MPDAPPTTALTTDAVDTARTLLAAGIPLFLAWPARDPDGAWDPTGGSGGTGYQLPGGWQQLLPEPRVLTEWEAAPEPKPALAMVCGYGYDVIDVDPRNGGALEALNGAIPHVYGVAATPSGGVHAFVASLGVRKRTNLVPGIDVQAGLVSEAGTTGAGFVFLAPTVKVSKVTGELVPYRWVEPLQPLPDAVGDSPDDSGAALAAMVRAAAPTPSRGAQPPGDGWWARFMARPPHSVSAAHRAIDAKLAEVSAWTPDLGVGFRETLLRASMTLGGYVGAAVIGEDDARAALESAVSSAWEAGPDDDDRLWIDQGLTDGAARPFDVVTDDQAIAALAAQADTEVSTPVVDPSIFFDKSGIRAALLADGVLSRGPLAVGADEIVWEYRGGVWTPDKHVVRARVAGLLGDRYRPSHVAVAEDVVRTRVPVVSSDPIEQWINFTNGLYDWRTGQLLPHTPEVLSTVQLAVDHVPDAACPAFERFLTEVVPSDSVDLVWELIAYLMYSGNPLHKAVMLTGKGRNGKGTLLRLIVRLLGRHNVASVALHDLVDDRFATAKLFGKIANIAGDIDAGYLENTAAFKGLTGGDLVSAQHKYRDRFEFTPWAVPVFSANKVPTSADTTVGYLSRWLVVPFPNDFTGREDRFLDARLQTTAELEGIAAHAAARLPDLLSRGEFELPPSAITARDDFDRRVDQVRTWIADVCDLHPAHPWLARTQLYAAYTGWAARSGQRPVKAAEFYDRLEAIGAEPAIIRGVRGFRGIKIHDGGGGGGMPGFGPYIGVQAPAPAPAPHLHPGPTEHPATTDSYEPVAESEGGCSQTDLTLKPALTSENSTQGAGGCSSHHPGIAGVRARDGRDGKKLHPPAPSTSGRDFAAGQLGTPDSTKIKKESPAAAAKRRAKVEEKRARLLESAGPTVPLPALVTPNEDAASADVATVAAALAGELDLTVDVEHTGYPVGHPEYRLKTIQVGTERVAAVLDADDPDQRRLARALLGEARTLHAHGAVADLVPLEHADVIYPEDAWAKMTDTALLSLLADPATAGTEAGLKETAAAVLGDAAVSPAADKARSAYFKAAGWATDTNPWTPVERSGWAQADVTAATMVRYAGADVLDGAALARALPRPTDEVLTRERQVERVTARISHRGLALHAEQIDIRLAESRALRDGVFAELTALGIDTPGSNPKVADWLTVHGARLPRTDPSKTHPDGQASVAGAVLEELAAYDDEAGRCASTLLRYRHHDKVVSAFLEPFDTIARYGDGRVRPVVNTLGARTGRMSCARPNLQQLPREGGVRSVVVADPGQLLVSADFAGVELRVAAALSQDADLIRLITDGVDLHDMVAQRLWGGTCARCADPHVKCKRHRSAAKRAVFAWLYGGQAKAAATGAGVPIDQGEWVLETLRSMVPGVSAWTDQVQTAVRNGATTFEAYSGRIIHLGSPHAAPNHCIQGTARELLVDALLAWDRTPWGGGVVLPVHDETLAMVGEGDAAAATDALVRCMTTELFGVPIVAEASAPAAAWADAT